MDDILITLFNFQKLLKLNIEKPISKLNLY